MNVLFTYICQQDRRLLLQLPLSVFAYTVHLSPSYVCLNVCLSHSTQVAEKLHFFPMHYIFGTVQDKMKQTSPNVPAELLATKFLGTIKLKLICTEYLTAT